MKQDALSGLAEALRNHPDLGPRYRELEAFDAEVESAVEHVMLDIAYSPILLSGDNLDEAVEIYEATDGRYVVRSTGKVLTVEETKRARARFLCARGKKFQPVIDRMFPRK
jgi:hypothetical protein